MSTSSGQNPLQVIADPLHALGENIGADTPLGGWLMSEVAAPVLIAVTALLVLLLLLSLRRRRRAAAAQARVQAQSGLDEPRQTALAVEPAAVTRTHPEALAMLYDAPARREPVLATQAGTAGVTAAAPAAVVTTMAEQPREPAAPAAAAEAPPRDQASLRLMVSAVDRLLQRVESQQAQIHALLDELKAQSSALLVQGERLLELEARVASLGGVPAPAAVEPAATEDQLPSLEQAIALAAQGAGEHELVSQLGLSAAEARLINLVHGQPQPAAGEPSADTTR